MVFQKLMGFGKLETIQLPDKTQISQDSLFYAFQKENIFSFTKLINSSGSSLSYGYADYPSSSKVHILMDSNNTDGQFSRWSHWGSTEATFNITENTSSKLVLEKGDTLFILKKY